MQHQVNKTYRARFSNKPSIKILEIKPNSYKVLLYPYEKPGEPVIRELDLSTVKLLGYEEFSPNLSVASYPFKIEDQDLEEVQGYFEESISKEMIIKAIELENWNGDWTEVIYEFGICGDTCNREYVIGNLEKLYQINSLA
jgi:hypothetical protein